MEHQILLEKLLQQDESLCLEFKSFWYWKLERENLKQGRVKLEVRHKPPN